jgi:hypothetical protein
VPYFSHSTPFSCISLAILKLPLSHECHTSHTLHSPHPTFPSYPVEHFSLCCSQTSAIVIRMFDPPLSLSFLLCTLPTHYPGLRLSLCQCCPDIKQQACHQADWSPLSSQPQIITMKGHIVRACGRGGGKCGVKLSNEWQIVITGMIITLQSLCNVLINNHAGWCKISVIKDYIMIPIVGQYDISMNGTTPHILSLLHFHQMIWYMQNKHIHVCIFFLSHLWPFIWWQYTYMHKLSIHTVAGIRLFYTARLFNQPQYFILAYGVNWDKIAGK